MNVTRKERAVKASAWILYTLIVLEILFMVSPFAAYYYSIYATPLNALQEWGWTAWLTMYVLPHFTYSDNWLANGLVLISWPLIMVGIVLFVLGFCQIYWSKITRKGAVEVGLYRHVRHPQYIALALIGLGASLYWSRFVVIIAFVAMLCLYYFLARTEERICLEKFGVSYRSYMERTGMFLPQRWENRWRRFIWRMPTAGWRRFTLIASLWVLVLALTTGAAHILRTLVIDSLQTSVRQEQVIVFLAPVDGETQAVVETMLEGSDFPGDLVYVAPSSWSVPELGLRGEFGNGKHGGDLGELLHPTTHGNALSYDQDSLNAVSARAAYSVNTIEGIERLSRALDLKPLEFVSIDVKARRLLNRQMADEGQWAGIPVPTF